MARDRYEIEEKKEEMNEWNSKRKNGFLENLLQITLMKTIFIDLMTINNCYNTV